jgi:hypothetical protein
MIKQAVRTLTIMMAILALAGFVVIYGYQIYKGWSHHISTITGSSQNDPADTSPDLADQKIDDPYSYVATSLASLVGAIVATVFGRSVRGISAKKRRLGVSPFGSLCVRLRSDGCRCSHNVGEESSIAGLGRNHGTGLLGIAYSDGDDFPQTGCPRKPVNRARRMSGRADSLAAFSSKYSM